jgi:uncharacterized membrane protein
MGRFKTHVRNKFVAGILAAIPVAVTFFILWYVDSRARLILGIDVPFLGIVVALGAIYLLGLFVTSVIGKFLIGVTDWILGHVPGLRDLYRSWKQVALTDAHDGTFGIFGQVVLVPDDAGRGMVIGFFAGHPVEGDPGTCCVFIPASPNPTSGRLHFVPQSRLVRVDLARQEAIKMIVSGGNYVPGALGAATSGAPRG